MRLSVLDWVCVESRIGAQVAERGHGSRQEEGYMQVCGELHVAVYTYLLLREALQAAILLHVSQA